MLFHPEKNNYQFGDLNKENKSINDIMQIPHKKTFDVSPNSFIRNVPNFVTFHKP